MFGRNLYRNPANIVIRLLRLYRTAASRRRASFDITADTNRILFCARNTIKSVHIYQMYGKTAASPLVLHTVRRYNFEITYCAETISATFVCIFVVSPNALIIAGVQWLLFASMRLIILLIGFITINNGPRIEPNRCGQGNRQREWIPD